jgi:dihydrofolate reductase
MQDSSITKSEIANPKSIISLIVAASENNAIGKDNKLLWNLPIDLKFFKNTTWGMPVVMGRKTFEAMGKPLNGRPNFVITTKKDWKAEGASVSSTIEDALKMQKAQIAKRSSLRAAAKFISNRWIWLIKST